MNKKYLEISFPIYNSFFGIEVGKMLSGEMDVTAINIDTKSMALWYAMDRYMHIKNLDLNEYDFILLNRYVLSNAVYQGSRCKKEDAVNFAEWVFELEFNQLGLPKPDLYILLDVSPEISKNNVLKKGFREYIGNKADVYESSFDMLNVARNLYVEFSNSLENIDIIKCFNENTMLPEYDIHEKIINLLRKNNIL